MPRAILQHVLRVDFPNVIEDLVHGSLQFRQPQTALHVRVIVGFIEIQCIVCSVMSKPIEGRILKLGPILSPLLRVASVGTSYMN